VGGYIPCIPPCVCAWLHFYVNDIGHRNVDLPIDSKCKKFALKSCCTPLDSTKNLTTFRETYSGEFYIIFLTNIVDLFSAKIAGYTFM